MVFGNKKQDAPAVPPAPIRPAVPIESVVVPPGRFVAAPPLTRFDRALAYVLENEGPYSNDPRDPGGATKFGIILTEYQAFLGRNLKPDDVKNMDLETAKAIYRKNFWLPIQGESYVSDAVATAIFDTAVNKGLGGGMVILTDALHEHFLTRYGTNVVQSVNAGCAGGEAGFLQTFRDATIRYINMRIQKFPNMEWARKGWTNRANRLLTLRDA